MPTWLRATHACLELLVALLFLGLIVTAFDSTICRPGPGHYAAARAQAARLENVVEDFRLECGHLPDRLDELYGVVRDRNCFTTPQRASQLVDPWGGRFVYWRAEDGSAFELRSVGRDRVYGSFDDVASGGWTWPWPQPPWSWQERGQRIGPAVGLALTALLVGALLHWSAAGVILAVRTLRRWLRPA